MIKIMKIMKIMKAYCIKIGPSLNFWDWDVALKASVRKVYMAAVTDSGGHSDIWIHWIHFSSSSCDQWPPQVPFLQQPGRPILEHIHFFTQIWRFRRCFDTIWTWSDGLFMFFHCFSPGENGEDGEDGEELSATTCERMRWSPWPAPVAALQTPWLDTQLVQWRWSWSQMITKISPRYHKWSQVSVISDSN